MFRSCGFFSSFPCPFYVNGLCERPYCHFRHSRHDVERARENNVSILSNISDSPESSTSHSPEQQSSVSGDSSQASALSKPQSSSSLFEEGSLVSGSSGKTLLQPNSSNFESSVGSVCIPSFTGSTYQVPVAEEQPEQYETPHKKDSDPLLGSSSLSGPNTGAADLPAYLPTPKTPSLPIPEPAKDDAGIPVYQPTPKVELKRRHKEQTPTKKAKRADLEYDPVSNYSCGGLIGLPHDEYQPEDDAADYKPTEKKARLSKLPKVKKRHRLSCESLIAGSTKDLTEDQEVHGGMFSDEEKDGSGSGGTGSSVQAMEEDVSNKDDKSDNFDNIGDDDISSDDDFIDVPNLPHSKPGFKAEKHSVKQLNRKYSVHGLEKSKTVSKKKDYSKAVSEKLNSSGSKHNQNKAKHASSKSSHKLPSESSSHKTVEKTSKSLSSEKKAGQSSSTNSLKKSASACGQCKEKCHPSHKLVHSSKQLAEQKTEHRKSELLSKSKAEAIKSKHTHSLSSSKSISKPSEKSHISSKHISPGKSSSSSSKLVSNSSSERRPSSDGKQKISLDRRSSCESTSKDGTSKPSYGEKHQKIMQSESSRKSGSSTGTKNSVKHSDSKTSEKLDKSGAGKKHKVCVCEKCCRSSSKTSSPGRSSSSGCKTGGAESHSSSSTSRKTSFSAGDQSKDRSVHSNKAHSSSKSGKEGKSLHIESQKKPSSSKDKVYHHSTKPDKECRSSHSDVHMSNSGLGKHSLSVNSKSSSTQNKKQSDSRSDSRVKSSSSSSKTLKRMNSSIFGDDSEEEVTEDMMPCDDDDALPDLTNDFSDNGGGVEEENEDYSKYIHESDLEDDDTFDECLRIFTETPLPKKAASQPDKKLIKDQKKDGPGHNEEIHRVSGKKRIAHKAAEEIRRPEKVKKERPRHLMSPQEQMHNRIMLMQQRAQERLRAAQQVVQEQEVSSTSGAAASAQPSRLNTGVKKRVAHVPKPATPSASSAAKAPSLNNQKKTTVVGTASKTEKRVAHTPNVSNLKRPMIPASFGSKVPTNIRQRYLNFIIDECLRFCPSEEQAYKKGLEEEAGVYERSNNKNIYLRVAVNTITRLRTEAKESMPGSSASTLRQPSSARSQSHEATLGGARAAKTNFTLHRTLAAGKKTEVVLTAPELYQRLLKYAMTEQQLVENGYPRPCPDTPGRAVMQMKSYQDTDTLLKANERTCSRCGKRFIVKSDGRYVMEEECVYHWTRAYPRKKSGFQQHIYNCCNSDTSSKGCQVAGNHVHEKNKRDDLTGFMRTMPRSPPRDGNYGIYALDCEMVYTIGGLELARITVIDTEGKSVYESLVQPLNAIVDYNTRFSGLTKADLKDVETTLTEVQAVLLNMFSAKTILIGHSLESDLFALKLIHATVVDTSMVFPHRLGPPYKRALKNLMLDIFQKIIQCDDGGHDSKEDAVACLQLMKWRIKEDSKRENRYSRD